MTPVLLPPNATLLERVLEKLTQRIDDVAVPLRDLVNPDRCPATHLPWLAFMLSIDAWNPDWSEQIKRSFIKEAIAVQRIKGTSASVRRIVAAFGGQIALREWWQSTPPGTPHTFSLTLNLNDQTGAPPTAQFVDEVIAEVGRTKPARAHFDFTQGLNAVGGLAIAGAARPAVYRRLAFEAA